MTKWFINGNEATQYEQSESGELIPTGKTQWLLLNSDVLPQTDGSSVELVYTSHVATLDKRK